MEEGSSSSLWDRFMHSFSEENEDQEDMEKEILALIREGREHGFFAGSEGEMISNIFSYNEKKAEDIMVHRKHIIALDGDRTLDEAMGFIVKQINSRLPVYDGDIDTIVGILHLRDAAKCYLNERLRHVPIKELKRYIRPVSFVPEGKSVDKLFKEMKTKKNHLVVVLDEYGQTAGLITMEDIIEEIVGNIQDEYDEEEEMVQKLSDGIYIVNGMTELEDLEKLLGIEFQKEDFGTLNGFLVHSLDHIPSDGENCTVEYSGYRFHVMSMNGKMIGKVRVGKI